MGIPEALSTDVLRSWGLRALTLASLLVAHGSYGPATLFTPVVGMWWAIHRIFIPFESLTSY